MGSTLKGKNLLLGLLLKRKNLLLTEQILSFKS